MPNVPFPIDAYDFRARLQPAILAIAPAVALIAAWLPQVRTWMGGATVTILGGAIATLLMTWVRQRGHLVQSKLEQQLQGLPTTTILRHNDTHLATATKARIHAALKRKGLKVPTKEQEAANPAEADLAYQSCVDWLLERTRADKLLRLDNIEYGFRRNLTGVKGPAVALLLACLAFDVLAMLFGNVTPKQLAAGTALAAAFLVGGSVWMILVNMRFVAEAGTTYARRLVAAAETL